MSTTSHLLVTSFPDLSEILEDDDVGIAKNSMSLNILLDSCLQNPLLCYYIMEPWIRSLVPESWNNGLWNNIFNLYIPNAQCIAYLPTFIRNFGQMEANIPNIEYLCISISGLFQIVHFDLIGIVFMAFLKNPHIKFGSTIPNIQQLIRVSQFTWPFLISKVLIKQM